MKRQNLRTVSLVVVTFTYLLFGAAIFGWLESDHESKQREILELIEQIIRRKYNITDDDYTVLTTTVIKSVPHKAGIQWKFPGAFYFATTVVTTIGYGHSTPSTVSGRSFCMAYALIGIPLGLVMFQSIGERLNTFVAAALRWAKRCSKSKNPEVTVTNLVMVVSVLSTILMTSMAAVFAKYERWDYFDALYYCFITLTTIGFGDYVALQKESALQSKPEYVILSLVFILFGLSVVSSAVNLLVLKFLTLNTEDERRDEQLRNTAAMNPVRVDGDVITLSAGKPDKLGGARQPPALTAAQHMARSSIKRDREALLAASWQRPPKRAQVRQQVPQSPVIGRLQSREATGNGSTRQTASSTNSVNSLDENVTELERDHNNKNEMRYCDDTGQLVRTHPGQVASRDLRPDTFNEQRWRETTTTTTTTTTSPEREPDDNSDDHNDSDRRLDHLSNLQAHTIVCAYCGLLEHELEYYLHEPQLDGGHTSACCQCHLADDNAPSATSIRISSGKTATIVHPNQGGQWTNRSTSKRVLSCDKTMASCCVNMEAPTSGGTAATTTTTRDEDSPSMGAVGKPTKQLKPAACGLDDHATHHHGEIGGQPTMSSCVSRSSSSLASSATRPPDDAHELATPTSVDQQQPPADNQKVGNQTAPVSFETTSFRPVQLRHHRRHHSSGHKVSQLAANDNCNCDDGANVDKRPIRRPGAQICRSERGQGRRKCDYNHQTSASGKQHFLGQHSMEAHQRQRRGQANQDCSPLLTNRVIDRDGQQAGHAMIAAAGSSQVVATPAANQSSCSCSWVSLGSACGSPAAGQVTGIRPLNTPTYAHDSCLVLDPESLQSADINRDKRATRIYRDGSSGTGWRKPSSELVGTQQACSTTTTTTTDTLLQSSQAFHGSEPPSSFLLRAMNVVPAGHRRRHQNDAQIMISPRQAPVLRRRSFTDDEQDYGGRAQIQDHQFDSVSLCPLQGINNEDDQREDFVTGPNEVVQKASGNMQSGTTTASPVCHCVNSEHDHKHKKFTISGCSKQINNTTTTTLPDRRKSSSSSSQKQHRVARLVCRCCCQHAECIEYAIEASGKRHRSQPLVCDPAGELLPGDATSPKTTTTTFQKSAPEANCDKTLTVEMSLTNAGSLVDLNKNIGAHGGPVVECGASQLGSNLAKYTAGCSPACQTNPDTNNDTS